MRFVCRWGTALVAVLAIAAFRADPAAAQQGSLTGIVTNASSGLPLAGATVRIVELDRTALTNEYGRFALLGVPAGSHELVVHYIGYADGTRTVTVGSGVTPANFQLEPSALEIDGLVATSSRDGQAAALSQQLSALSISNIVAADQIGRFPDSNIGDAMKRLPGITVIWDQGEARFGLIRGTEPKYNSVMINGERIPSAEAEVREVQLDLIPSDMVRAIEVSKTLTPDMDADAIGGAVNIVTRAAPTQRRISATLGSGYNFLVDQGMSIGSFVYGDRYGADDRFGLVLSGSHFAHRLGSDNIEGEWDLDGSTPFLSEFQTRRYDITRIRRSISGSLDFRLAEGSTIFWRSMYNHRDDLENRWRTVHKFDGPGLTEATVERQSKGGINDDRVDNRRLEDQRTQAHSLSGEHLFGSSFFEWSVQYARASESRPNERYVEWEQEDLMLEADISDPRRPQLPFGGNVANPALFSLNELTEETQFTKDEDINARVDLTVPIQDGRTEFKFGLRLRDKDKERDNDFFEYEPTSGFGSLAETGTFLSGREGFIPGDEYDTGVQTTQTYLGELDLDGSGFERTLLREEFAAANFDATERIFGGYLMATRKVGERTTLVGGLRVESTDIDYNGNSFNEDTEEVIPQTGGRTYTDFFPSLQMRHEISSRQILRAAVTTSIARPGYFELVPYRILVPDDNEAEIGNPDLDPTRALNLDLMYEQYFDNVGIFSAGLFYKDITDFIFNFTRQGVQLDGILFDEVTQPLNGANATLFGAEVSFQRNLDEIIPGLGIYGNYTFNESSVENIGIEGREDDDFPLPGTSRHTLNASLSYDRGRVSLRGSLNYQDDFIDPGEIGSEAFFDRYYDDQTTIDLNGAFVLNDQARFFFEVNNLTNQPLRYYQGIAERTMQEEFYNTRFQAGLKIDMR